MYVRNYTRGVQTMDRMTDELRAAAKRRGEEDGRAQASWAEISEANAAAIVRGIEDGDPEVMDAFREPDLSGEWADEPTPRSLAYDLGVTVADDRDGELEDEIADLWEEAARATFWTEIERRARYYLS